MRDANDVLAKKETLEIPAYDHKLICSSQREAMWYSWTGSSSYEWLQERMRGLTYRAYFNISEML